MIGNDQEANKICKEEIMWERARRRGKEEEDRGEIGREEGDGKGERRKEE